MRIRTRAIALGATLITLTTGLTACAGDVPLTAAPDANNPTCADIIVRLPQTVADLERRTTNAQSTGAWGDPAGVLLYCGTDTSGPTVDDCVNVNGVDWIIDRSNAPMYKFEAYGRTPGLQVIVNSEMASGTETVVDLSVIAKMLPQSRQCTSLSETMNL